MTNLDHSQPQLPIACVHCGEVTRHVRPYDGAPLERWTCEHAHAHARHAPRWELFLLSARARRGCSRSHKPN
jgi:hypothetical protein